MRKKYLSVALPIITVGCLLSTPLVSNKPLALICLRLIGTIAGLGTLMRKTETELSWLEAEKLRLSQERDELSKRYIADTEILEGWVKDESLRLANEANERIRAVEGQVSSLVDQAYSEAELWQSKALELEERLAVYLLPRKPKGVGRLETVAGRIIDFYYSQGILVDYEDCWTDNEYDLIRLKPRSGAKEQLQKLGDELQLELRLSRQPTFSIVQGTVQIRLETTGTDTRIAPDKSKVIEPSPEFLKTIVETCYSFRVNGESGSGKSTFVRHLIALFGNTDIILTDPKYPMSFWDIAPKYKGIDEALQGLLEASELVESRLGQARADKDAGKPIRSFKRILYIFDEIDWTVTHYGVDAANALRVTLKVGRALGVNILYLGQTPLASRLKMNRDDFRHSANFFLGENIPAAIEETCLSGSLKSDLEAQYQLRQQSKLRYSMLVKVPGSQSFLASLPSLKSEPLTGLEDNLGSDRVPTGVPESSKDSEGKSTDELKRLAIDGLAEGLSRTEIVKELWGYKGRRYPSGISLWRELELG